MKHLLHLLPVVLLAAIGFVISCENEKTSGDGDAILEVSPSYTKLRRGASVSLTASGVGVHDFVWDLEDPAIGSLSARHGKSVVYTAQVCQSEDTMQTVHVYSGVSGSTNALPSARYTGSATILHTGTGDTEQPQTSETTSTTTTTQPTTTTTTTRETQVNVRIKASAKEIRETETITLTASGGGAPSGYKWERRDDGLGFLSSSTGSSVRYTATANQNATQYITVSYLTGSDTIAIKHKATTK